MEIEKFKKKIEKIFAEKKIENQDFKKKLRVQILQEFSRQKRKKRIFQIFSRVCFSLIFFAVFLIFPSGSEIFALKILPKFGPVEIIRDGRTILAESELPLQIGDLVKIGNRAEAEIFSENFFSAAKMRTKFRVISENEFFLETGEIENNTKNFNKISTDRGFVHAEKGAKFSIKVLESGETKIINQQKKIQVFDWNNGKKILSSGEKINLRTDTKLANLEIPADLKISDSQILAIKLKLAITRTKILNGLENLLIDKKISAEKDFLSAKKTFKSIVQVLFSTRDLQILQKKNLELITIKKIFPAVSQKIFDPQILNEIRALENLFLIVQKNKNNFGFVILPTKIPAFDRFVLIEKIFEFGRPDQKIFAEILQEKYVIDFLQKVQNNQLKIDQISEMNKKISALPQNFLAKKFLTKLKNRLSPFLAEILDEKIRDKF